MNSLDELYQRERRKDDLNAAERAAARKELLAHAEPPAEPRRIRQAIGGKLIEWGERLQETPPATELVTNS